MFTLDWKHKNTVRDYFNFWSSSLKPVKVGEFSFERIRLTGILATAGPLDGILIHQRIPCMKWPGVLLLQSRSDVSTSQLNAPTPSLVRPGLREPMWTWLHLTSAITFRPNLQIKHLGLCSELLDVLLSTFLASSMSRPLKIWTTLEHALLMVLTQESFLWVGKLSSLESTWLWRWFSLRMSKR